MTIESKLKEIRERERKASNPPWKVTDNNYVQRKYDLLGYGFNCDLQWDFIGNLDVTKNTVKFSKEDAEFIAHARQDIPLLLDALEIALDNVEERNKEWVLEEIQKLFEEK